MQAVRRALLRGPELVGERRDVNGFACMLQAKLPALGGNTLPLERAEISLEPFNGEPIERKGGRRTWPHVHRRLAFLARA